MIDIQVRADPKKSYIVRDGPPVWIYGASLYSFYGERATILGLDKNGKETRGGIALSAEAMDELAFKWLEARGKNIEIDQAVGWFIEMRKGREE